MKKLFFLFTLVLLAISLCTVAYAMDGSGTEQDPYLVKTTEDFVAVKNNLSAYYRLEADIEASSDTGAIVEGDFKGVFDGNGHTITVTINAPTTVKDDTFDATFGTVSGTVKNLTVKGSVNGSNKVAGVVGKLNSSGRIENCKNYATIYGRKNVGGIAGVLFDSAVVENCINYGSISGTAINKGVDMGGIVGCVWYTGNSHKSIINCANLGSISGTGDNCGGIVGFFYAGEIENCINMGKISSTSSTSRGTVFGCTEQSRTHTVNGYFSTVEGEHIGVKNGTVYMKNYLLESDGVAIYLGQGSGIRGEFHANEAMVEMMTALSSDLEFEYGVVVSTKTIVEELQGNLLSKDAQDNKTVLFAPAMKNGEKKYFYTDADKGEGYHSFRFALTNFPDNKQAYNLEFVILGYVTVTDKEGNTVTSWVNTVESEGLASAVPGTDYNAVNILRVAEVTVADGDYDGNDEVLEKLNYIIGFKEYNNRINIDGETYYGHVNATFTSHAGDEDGTVVFKITNTNKEEFDKYISELILAGYDVISQRTVNENEFYTFGKADVLINVSYFKSTDEVTVSKDIVEKTPSNMQSSSYVKENESSVTQIKMEDNVSIKEGMSYVIHLEDGTFLIIDGGWCYDDYLEADKLYDVLVSLAGEGNDIVIAGWIFTHCHGDHIGTFNYFIEKYHDSVTVNQLAYNFPPESEIATSASSYMLNDTKQRYNYFKQMISTYLEDTEIVRLHSGYKLYYANAEVDILQTYEDLYPSSVANNGYDFNSSSTIFTVTVGGQKMMFLGDVSDVGASRLTSMFGATLKSDFMQIAHHGINNGATIKALYKAIDAEYILYPAPLDWYRNYAASEANYYVASESQTVKQIFVSGYQTVTISLPYDGTLFDGEKIPMPGNDSEAQRPTSPVDVPDAYFDLDLTGGTATDAKGNATVTVTGGAIKETTVSYGGEDRTATAFTKGESGNYYMTLNFNDIKTDAQWSEFVMGSSTFEIFLKLDQLPGATVGLITSCNGGGTTLYLRRQAGGQINFQIGSTIPNSNRDGSNYSAAANMGGTLPLAEAGKPLHIVGTYDSESNMMRIYINGILVAEADYGQGEFRGGSGNDYVIGIGYNPQYSGEVISQYTDYELYEARIYATALTEEQVAQQYWNCIDNLLVAEAGNE